MRSPGNLPSLVCKTSRAGRGLPVSASATETVNFPVAGAACARSGARQTKAVRKAGTSRRPALRIRFGYCMESAYRTGDTAVNWLWRAGVIREIRMESPQKKLEAKKSGAKNCRCFLRFLHFSAPDFFAFIVRDQISGLRDARTHRPADARPLASSR